MCEADDEPEGPVFFLSYAHGPNPELVDDFFRELCGHVQQLFGLSADLVGFMTTCPCEAASGGRIHC